MEDVKVLCIGDPHFKPSNVEEVEEMIFKTIEYVKKSKPTFVVILGDILDTHEKVNVSCFKLATNFIKQLSLLSTTYLVIGNHDLINNTQFLSDNHAFNSLKEWENVYIIDKVCIHEHNDMKFGFVPYVYPGRFNEALETSDDVWELCSAIFCHQEFKGCKLGAIISENGDEWDEGNPLVISGHIHDHQIVKENIFYTGSSLQHGFNENVKKSLWEFEFKQDDEYSYRDINLKLKSKKVINLDIEDISSFDSTEYEDCILKVNLNGTTEQFKTFRQSKKYKELNSKNIKISFNPTLNQTKPQDIKTQDSSSEKKTYLTIFKDLVEKENKKDLKDVYEEVVKDL